jgi:hypothetical protein
MPHALSKATQGALPLTSAGSASHTARFKAAMFGLIPSIHDGGELQERRMKCTSLLVKRVQDGDALVVDAVGSRARCSKEF